MTDSMVAEMVLTTPLTLTAMTRLTSLGGKAELVAATTRSAGSAMASTLQRCLDEPDPIAAFVEMWSAVLAGSEFEGGCPIGAAACSRDVAPAAAAADVFAEWAQLIPDRLTDDGGYSVAAQSLPMTIIATMEGAVVLSRAARSTLPLEHASWRLQELVVLHHSRPRCSSRSR